MHVPPGRISERMVFVNRGNRAPGALLLAYEDDTWMLAIARPVDCGSPPKDFAESVAAAEEILPARLSLRFGMPHPFGEIAISHSTAAVWSRYDRLPRLPAGLLVIGDALCHLNPIYGQGTTVAALQVLALRDCLRAGDADLARRFYSATAADIGPVWAMNAINDRTLSPVLRARCVGGCAAGASARR